MRKQPVKAIKSKAAVTSRSIGTRTPLRSKGLDAPGLRLARLRRREKAEGSFGKFWDAEEEEKHADEDGVTKTLDFSAFLMNEDGADVEAPELKIKHKEIALALMNERGEQDDQENWHPNLPHSPRRRKTPRHALKELRQEGEASVRVSSKASGSIHNIPIFQPFDTTKVAVLRAATMQPFEVYQSPQRQSFISGTWHLDTPPIQDNSMSPSQENTAEDSAASLATPKIPSPGVRRNRPRLCILQRMFG